MHNCAASQKEAFSLAGRCLPGVGNDAQANTRQEPAERRCSASAVITTEKRDNRVTDGHSDQTLDVLCCNRAISPCATPAIALIFPSAFALISSIFSSACSALLRLVINSFLSLSIRRRLAISPCMATTMNPALLSPSIFTDSMSCITSWGMRAVTDWDLELLEPVDINEPSWNWCITVYTKVNYTKELKCKPLAFIFNYTLSTDKAQEAHKIATPRSGGTLPRRLTTNVIKSNEVAMSDHTTPITGRNTRTQQHTQGHQRFVFIFVAIRRNSPKIAPEMRHVSAFSENEARKVLVSDFVLLFAGRLPIQEVEYA